MLILALDGKVSVFLLLTIVSHISKISYNSFNRSEDVSVNTLNTPPAPPTKKQKNLSPLLNIYIDICASVIKLSDGRNLLVAVTSPWL